MIKNSDPVLYKSFLTAQECHQAGDLTSAEAIYSRLLALDPADDELLFLFGNLQVSKGAIDVGLECLRLAQHLKPSNPRIAYAIGQVLQEVGRWHEAVEAYRTALALNPDSREARDTLCSALIQIGQSESAKQLLEHGGQGGLQGEVGEVGEVLAGRMGSGARVKEQINTEYQDALYKSLPVASIAFRGDKKTRTTKPAKPGMLARKPAPNQQMIPGHQEINALAILFNEGRYAEAVVLAQEMTLRFPLHGFGWMVLGVVFSLTGRNAEALSPLQKAVALSPDNAEAHCNLGNTFQYLGRLTEAEAHCRRALEIKPDMAEAHSNLGNTLKDLGRLAEAAASYLEAVEIKPDFAMAHNNLGVTLHGLGRYNEAKASYRRALEIKPDYADAHNNLGVVQQSLGWLDEAESSYRRALEFQPSYSEAHNNLGNVLKDQGRLDEAETSYRRALEIKPDFAKARSNLLFVLSFHAVERRDDIFLACREYDELFCLPYREKWQAYTNSREANRRLRIGYVSPDFRRHAVAFFAEPIFANHDKSQVEIFCYAEVEREDEYTHRFRQFADHWDSTVGLGDDAVVKMIRNHQIDILVDLAGHTAGNRLLSFGRKPAPLQLTYLGYPGTTGLSAIDYRITDRHADPEGVADAYYSERLLRLPDSLCCYRPAADMPEPSVLPALLRGYLTFGSFNNFNKIDQGTLALWAELLRALPTARLMMLTVPAGEIRLRLERSFAELGIDSQRLEFYGRLPAADYYRKFQEVDIAIDPVSVSGGTTTCESLWMGVPVMSLVGERFITRVSYSFLHTAGLADFATGSPKEFVRIATHLADNLPLLAEIRAGLREHLVTSPLIDEVGFTRNLENLYREIWGKWCCAT